MKSKKKIFGLKPAIVALCCGICLISSVAFSFAWFISNRRATGDFTNIRYGDNINIINSYIVTRDINTFSYPAEDKFKVTLQTYDIYIELNNENINAIVVLDLTLSEGTFLLVTTLGEEVADSSKAPLSYVAHTSYYLAPIADLTLEADGSVSYATANANTFVGQNTLATYTNNQPTNVNNEYSFTEITTTGRYLLFVSVDYDKTNMDNFFAYNGTGTDFDSANGKDFPFESNITILLGNAPTRTA